MVKRFLLAFIVLLAVFGGLFGYKAYVGYKNKIAMSHMKFPPAYVSVSIARSGNWQPLIQAIGSISSPQSVNITTQVPGQVVGIFFKSGEFVKKGTLLVKLDDSLQLDQLKQYRAQLIINKFNYEQYKKAYLKNAVSKASYIQMLSTMEQNQALISQTLTTIHNMYIRAPFSGVLGVRDPSQVNLGQYINPGANIIPLYSVNPVYADFTLPQNDIKHIKVGQSVKIYSDAYPEKSFTGKIKAISVNVNNVSRNIIVRVSIENKGLLLKPGMYVTGSVELPLIQNIITIPATAVTYNPYGDFVYIVEKNKGRYAAKTVYVTVGSEKNGRIEILKGMKKGQMVVTAGQVRLENGSAVIIKSQAGEKMPIKPSGVQKTMPRPASPGRSSSKPNGTRTSY